MIFNIFQIVVMAIAFLYTFNKAQYAQTRLVALVPLGMVLVDVCSVQGNFLLTPVLAVIMVALRLIVLGCCGIALAQDRRMARAQARRRVKQRLVVHTSQNVCSMAQYA